MTKVGLVLGAPALVSGGKMRWVQGVLEIHGGFVTHLLCEWTLLEGGASDVSVLRGGMQRWRELGLPAA